MNQAELYKRLRAIGLSEEESLKEAEGFAGQAINMNQESKCKIDKDGDKYWTNAHGEYHREDGPAVEYINGYKAWYINGKRHREDGPAVELVSGHKEWFINNKRHREDGPAIEYADGDKEWWFHGKWIDVSTQEEFDAYYAP